MRGLCNCCHVGCVVLFTRIQLKKKLVKSAEKSAEYDEKFNNNFLRLVIGCTLQTHNKAKRIVRFYFIVSIIFLLAAAQGSPALLLLLLYYSRATLINGRGVFHDRCLARSCFDS